MFDSLNASLQELMNPEDSFVSEDTGEGYESSVSEVLEAEASVQSAFIALANAETVFDSLESLQSITEQLSGEEGLSSREAMLLSAALMVAQPGAGFDQMVSVQEFGSESSRKEATDASMQAMGESLKRVWQAIKNGVQKMLAAIADLWARIFSSLPKLKAKLQEMKKSIGTAKKDKPEMSSDNIKISGASRLAYKGKLDAASVIAGLDATTGVVSHAVGGAARAAAVLKDMQNEYVKAMGMTDDEINAKNAKTVDDLFNGTPDAIAAVVKTVVTLQGKEFAGGRAVIITTDEDISGSKGGSVRVGKATGANPGNETQEVKAWSHDDSIKVIDSTIKLVDVLMKAKDSGNKITEGRKKAMDAAEKVIDKFDKGGMAKWFDKTKTMMFARRASKDAFGYIPALTNAGYGTARAALAAVTTAEGNFKAKA